MKVYEKDKLVKVAPCCKMHNNGFSMLTADEIGQLTPQQIFEHEKFQQLRHDTLNNVRNEKCKICWDQEDRGIISYRLKSQWNKKSREEIFSTLDLQTELIEFDVSFSNKCNLVCRMCNFGGSHQFYKDIEYFKKHGMMTSMFTATSNALSDGRESIKTENNVQLNWLLENFKQIRILKISGGEPLYDKKVLKLLNLMIEHDHAKNVVIQFHTNASLLDDHNINLLNQFRSQSHVFSVDGTEKTYNYIRHNSDFYLVEDNIINWIAKSSNINNINFNMVLSALNVLNLKEYFEWIAYTFAYKYSIRVHVSEIRPFTRGTSLYHLPKEILEIAKTRFLEFKNDSSTWTNDLIKRKRHSPAMRYDTENILRLIDLGIEKNSFDKHKGKLKTEVEIFDKSRNQSYKDFLDPLLVDVLNSI